MTWRPVGMVGSAASLAHFRHDLANMLLPLTLAADTNAGASAGLPSLLTPLLEQSGLLDLLLEPAVPRERKSGRFVCGLVGANLPRWTPGRSVFLLDPESLRRACSPFGKPVVHETGDDLALIFPADDRWKAAAKLAIPATPYGVRGVRLELAVLGAVAARHDARCEADTDTGAVRVTLPGEPG